MASGSLTNNDQLLLTDYAAVTSLVPKQAQLGVLSAAVDDAQTAFDTNPNPANLLALQTAQSTFNSAYANFSAEVLAYDSAADPATFDALAEQSSLAGSAVSAGAATEIGNPTATVADLLTESNLREGAVALAQDNVTTADGALVSAQAALAPLGRSDLLLTAASTSGQENIELAAGALTGDPAADGSNYETEVLGALTDHETRITANAEASVAGDAATLASANTYTDTSVAGEAALRVAGDAATLASANTYTDTSVADEAALRVAGDARLGNRISAEETARIAADTAETNARIAADTALGSRITSETNERIAADNILRDKIASSTATAIALGGAVILPDVNFTLSGNVGFYEGAQAIAVNGAARVAPNTYVTGAFGGGLNKRGAVGGRVGLVFGF